MINIQNKLKGNDESWHSIWHSVSKDITRVIIVRIDVFRWNEFWRSILIQPNLK